LKQPHIPLLDLGLDHGAPSAPTYSRILRRLDPAALTEAIGQALAGMVKTGLRLALDGKTLRAAHEKESGKPAHILHAVCVELGECLHAVLVDGKHNEVVAARDVIALILKRFPQVDVVTGDAMFAHRDLCRAILDAGRDYLFKLKENQPTQLEEARRLLGRRENPEFVETQVGHGRIETYRVFVTGEIAGWMDWPGLQSALRIQKTTEHVRGGSTWKTTVSDHYALSSLPPQAQSLFSVHHGHWGVEASFQFKDVTLREDRCAVHSADGALVAATMHSFAHTLLKRLAAGKRYLSRLCADIQVNPTAVLAALGLAKGE